MIWQFKQMQPSNNYLGYSYQDLFDINICPNLEGPGYRIGHNFNGKYNKTVKIIEFNELSITERKNLLKKEIKEFLKTISWDYNFDGKIMTATSKMLPNHKFSAEIDAHSAVLFIRSYKSNKVLLPIKMHKPVKNKETYLKEFLKIKINDWLMKFEIE